MTLTQEDRETLRAAGARLATLDNPDLLLALYAACHDYTGPEDPCTVMNRLVKHLAHYLGFERQDPRHPAATLDPVQYLRRWNAGRSRLSAQVAVLDAYLGRRRHVPRQRG